MASCLLAVGLYTSVFETVIVMMKVAINDYLVNSEPEGHLGKLKGLVQTNTSYQAINYCAPLLVGHRVVTRADIKFLHKARKRRNELAHDAARRVLVSPRLSEVLFNIDRMIDIASRLEEWQRSHWKEPSENVAILAISLSGILQSSRMVAVELAKDTLDEPNQN